MRVCVIGREYFSSNLIDQLIDRFDTVEFVDPKNDFCAAKLFEDFNLVLIRAHTPIRPSLTVKKKIGSGVKILATVSTGTTHIDKAWLIKNDINLISLEKLKDKITSVTSTAELALLFTLMGARDLSFESDTKENNRQQFDSSRELSKCTIGILGFGRLGRTYYRFVKPLAKNVLVYEQNPVKTNSDVAFVENATELFSNCNAVSVHIPETESNNGFITASMLESTTKHFILVNTSRPSVLEDKALDFIERKKLRYYSDFRDSYTERPLLKGRSTTHIGGLTADAIAAADEVLLQEIFRELRL